MAALCAQKAFRQAALSKGASRTPASRSAVVVRAAADRKLWAPTVNAPAYLNGELAGDYGKHDCHSRCSWKRKMVRSSPLVFLQVLIPWVWEPIQLP